MDPSEVLAITHGLARATDLRLRLVDARHWAWCHARRTLFVPVPDVEGLPRHVLLGRIAQGAGCCIATRAHLFASDEPRWLSLWLANVLEGPRAERVVVSRYPGARPWLEAARAHASSDGSSLQLRTLKALHAIAREGWAIDEGVTDEELDLATATLPSAVREALRATRAARRRYLLDFHPAADRAPGAEVIARHRDLGLGYASAAEAQMQVLAHDAWALARREVLPWVTRLLEWDADQLGRRLQRVPLYARRAREAVKMEVGYRAAELVRRLARSKEDVDLPPTSRRMVTVAHGLIRVVFETRHPISVVMAAPDGPRAYLAPSPPSAEEVVETLVPRLAHLSPTGSSGRRGPGASSGSCLDPRRGPH